MTIERKMLSLDTHMQPITMVTILLTFLFFQNNFLGSFHLDGTDYIVRKYLDDGSPEYVLYTLDMSLLAHDDQEHDISIDWEYR